MARFRMILLDQANNKKTVFDYSTGEYLEYYEQSAAHSSQLWFIVQPFVIFALETYSESLMLQPFSSRLMLGSASFLFAMILISLAWEIYLASWRRRIRSISRIIQEPSAEVQKKWAEGCRRRCRNAFLLTGAMAAVTTCLLLAFILTGITAFLSIAACAYCLLYFVLGIAQPGLTLFWASHRQDPQ